MDYEIIPVPTRILTSRDDIVEAVKEYGKGKFGPDDVICAAESVVAITQGMAMRCEEFKPGFLAKTLCHFFPSYGSISGWYCMQALIDTESNAKVLWAFIVGAVTKKKKKKGVFYRKEDGSVWADLTADGLDHKILLRSDGTSVYITQDIGTAKLRYQDYPIDKMIYVVGNEQNYHFQVLSLLLDRLGFKWGKDLIHFSYGMVELPNGKMKSREGTVVDADDRMDKMVLDAFELSSEKLADMTLDEKREVARIIGMGALKYFILKVDPRKNMLFNPEESIDFNGNTGPFIQYTYARIRSLLRKAGDNLPALDVANVVPNDKEIAIIQRLADFATTVTEAGKTYSPALIANYTYELAKEFNQFYHDYSILKEDDDNVKVFRLELSRTVASVIKRALSLLGIEVPERM